MDNVHQKLSKVENIVEAKDAPSRAKKVVEMGDVLYSTVRPYLHNICIVDKKFAKMPIASTAFCVMHVNDKVLNNKYLFYWLLSAEFDKFSNGNPSKGTLYPAIGEKDLLNGVIPLPSVQEQEEIVSRIEDAFDSLERLDNAQKRYLEDIEILKSKLIDASIQGKLTAQIPEDGTAEELFAEIQAEKQQLIKDKKIKKEKALADISEEEIPFEIPSNWKWVRLEGLTANINIPMADGPFGSNLKKEHYTEKQEVRIIQLSNVGQDGWKNENVKYTTFEHLKTIERSAVNAGEIVIAKMMPAGRAIIVPDIEEQYVLSSDCVKFVPHPKLLTTYINYAINSDMFRKQVLGTITGVGRERTSLSKLKNFLIPIPPYAEQVRIVEKLDSMLQLI